MTVSQDINVEIVVPADKTSFTAKYKAVTDADDEFLQLNEIRFSNLSGADIVRVTGSAAQYVSAKKDIAVIDRVASTVQGFRVVMTGADEQWFGVKAKNVIVNLLRHRDIAFPWEQFESIEVVLRDSAEVAAVLAANADADITGQNIASVTVANMVGDLSFSTSYSPSDEYNHDGVGDTDDKKSSVSDAVFASGGSSGIDTLKIRIGTSEERFSTAAAYVNPYRENNTYSVPETAHHKNEVYATAIFRGRYRRN